jgi:hypothetical protein
MGAGFLEEPRVGICACCRAEGVHAVRAWLAIQRTDAIGLRCLSCPAADQSTPRKGHGREGARSIQQAPG